MHSTIFLHRSIYPGMSAASLFRLVFRAVFAWVICVSPKLRGDDSLSDLRGVWQAGFNDDASRIVVQMRGGGISLWKTATGKAVCRDMGRGRETEFYVLRPDWKAALIAFRPRGAQLVDLLTGEPISPQFDVEMMETFVTPNAAFSPDMRTLVVFDRACSAHVFEVLSGKHRIAPIPTRDKRPEDRGQIRNVKFTADGAWCFLSDSDGSVVRYDTKTWKTSGAPIRHGGEPYYFGFDVSADGKWLATNDGGGDCASNDTLQMWDVVTAKPLGDTIHARNGVSGQFLTSPCRLVVRTGRIGGGGVFDLPSGTLRFPIVQHDDLDGPAVAVSPDRKWLLSSGPDHFLTLQDASTGKERGRCFADFRAADVLFSPDSRSCFVVLDHSTFDGAMNFEQSVMRIRLPEMKIDGSIRVPDFIARAVLSADGRKLLVVQGVEDKEHITVFDTRTMKAK